MAIRSFVLESDVPEPPRKSRQATSVKKSLNAFLRNEAGLTIVEYAVAAGLISAALVASMTLLGSTVDGIIQFLIANI